MLQTEKYLHHGIEVSVLSRYKGMHRELCLCFNECSKFKPDTPDNCPIAEKLYQLDKSYGLVTPVLECLVYEPRYTHAVPNTQA